MHKRNLLAFNANSFRNENRQELYKGFDFRLVYKKGCSNTQRNGDSERSKLDCFFLDVYEEQKILSEIQFKSHLWSVFGEVQKGIYPINMNYVSVLLYVHVQPTLDIGESATLEVSCPCSNLTFFEIRPSAIPRSKYGPYRINITISKYRGGDDFGILTLTLMVGKVGDPNFVPFTEKQPNAAPMNSFLEYSNQLFQSRELSDVTLKIRGKAFPAHKLLLSSLSPVFRTMFQSDFSESRSNVVEIKDFQFEVIHEMLKFMYTHKLPQFQSPDCNVDILSLYKASHKYEIKYLFESCREELSSTISIESALDVLLLADVYDDALLKKKSLDFICKNPPAVDDVSKFEKAVRQRPGLMKDILTCKFKER